VKLSHHIQQSIQQGKAKYLSMINKSNIFNGEYSLEHFKGNHYCKTQNLALLLTSIIDKTMNEENVDVIVCPTMRFLPLKLPDRKSMTFDDCVTHGLSMVDNTVHFNLTGQPALTVPTLFSRKENLPIGLQIISRQWNDEICIQVGNIYEQIRGPI